MLPSLGRRPMKLAEFTAPLQAAITRVGHGLRQGAVHQVDDALAGPDPQIDRGGMLAIEDRALGRRHRDRPRQPGIRQDGRVDDGLDGVIDGGEQRRVDHVEAGADLRRALEMQVDLLPADPDLDREGQVAVERRIVEPVGEAVGAVGDGGDPGAHLALGIVQELLAGRAAPRRARTSRTAPSCA